MPKNDFQQYICRPFCGFFRENTKEELACKGALIIEKLVMYGRLSPNLVSEIKSKDCQFRQKYDATLETAVCDTCPFAVDGCDFHAGHGKTDAEPCGGYILLKHLKETGTISSDDLKGGPTFVA